MMFELFSGRKQKKTGFTEFIAFSLICRCSADKRMISDVMVQQRLWGHTKMGGYMSNGRCPRTCVSRTT